MCDHDRHDSHASICCGKWKEVGKVWHWFIEKVRKNKKAKEAAPSHNTNVEAIRLSTTTGCDITNVEQTHPAASEHNYMNKVEQNNPTNEGRIADLNRYCCWKNRAKENNESSVHRKRKKKKKQSCVVLNVALSYSIAFLMSYLLPMVISIFTLANLKSGFWLSIVARIFGLLQLYGIPLSPSDGRETEGDDHFLASCIGRSNKV